MYDDPSLESLEIEPPSTGRLLRSAFASSNGEAQHPFEDAPVFGDFGLTPQISPMQDAPVFPPILSQIQSTMQSTNRSRTSRSSESARAIKQMSHGADLLDDSLLGESECLANWNIDDNLDTVEQEQPFHSARGFGIDVPGGRYTAVATLSDDDCNAGRGAEVKGFFRGGCCSSLRARCKVILEDPGSSPLGFYVEYFIIFLIVSSVTCAIVETVPDLKAGAFFMFTESLFTGLFSLEVLLRYWTSDSSRGYFTNYFNVIDIMSTLPGYADLFMRPLTQHTQQEQKKVKDLSDSMQTLRLAQLVKTIRLFRILRLAKVIRQSESIVVVIKSIWGSLRGLWVLVSFVLLSTVLAATICFFFEAQTANSKFESIPASIWWAASTILAVGYGDIVPQTVPGKITAIATMLVGTVLIAVCIAVITSSFTELYQKNLYIARMKALRTRVQHSRRLSKLPEFDPKQLSRKSVSKAAGVGVSREGSRRASKEVGCRKASKASVATIDSDGESDTSGNMDIAECVTQLEDMTSTLLLGFESLVHSQTRDGKCAELTLEILRKNSRLWFEHVRAFTEELCKSELSPRQPPAPVNDRAATNSKENPASRSSVLW